MSNLGKMTVGDVIATPLFLRKLNEERKAFSGNEHKYKLETLTDEEMRAEYINVLEKKSELNRSQRDYVDFLCWRVYRKVIEELLAEQNKSLLGRLKRLFRR